MLVLVDGHNLIAKLSDIRLDEADDEEKLILKLRRYRARTGRRVTVVFDPGSAYKLANQQTKGGLTIQYAPYGKSADQVIMNRLCKAKNPAQIMVVTSDRAIQQVARQVRARVVASSDFAAELDRPLDGHNDNSDIQLSEREVEEWLEIFTQQCNSRKNQD
jgi:predicted RNA-binding protein with PIN domain